MSNEKQFTQEEKAAYAAKKREKREAIAKANTDALHNMLLTGEKWPAYLETLADHPHRSPLNLAAIAASELAGSKELRTFDEWNELGANIKRGSKGIPVIVKDGKYFDAATWYGESQVTGAEDRFRGLANKNPEAIQGALSALGEHEFLTETEKWVFERRYGLNDDVLPPVAERELFARELQESAEIGVPELLRDLCKRISSLSNTMDIALGQSQVETRYATFDIPKAFTRDFVSNDQTRLVDVTIPPGTTLADGTDIGRYHFIVNESMTVDTDNAKRVIFPRESSKTGQDWNVSLSREIGHTDEATGAWVSEEVQKLDITSSDLAERIRAQREAYLAQMEKSQNKEAPEKSAPVEQQSKTKTEKKAPAKAAAKEPAKKAATKAPKARAKSVEELAERGTKAAKEHNEALDAKEKAKPQPAL